MFLNQTSSRAVSLSTSYHIVFLLDRIVLAKCYPSKYINRLETCILYLSFTKASRTVKKHTGLALNPLVVLNAREQNSINNGINHSC